MKPALLSGALSLFLASSALSGQLVVNTTADQFDTPSGSQRSLREAVRDAAASGDSIVFQSNVFLGRTILLTNGQIVIDKNLAIDASSFPGGIIMDANNLSRIFSINSGKTVTLKGLTLTRGNASSGGGGAIYNDRGNLTLNTCTLFENRSSGAGGGIYNKGDSGTAVLTLNSCTLAHNSADSSGGAIYSDSGVNGSATVNLDACTISANYAGSAGGGINNTLASGGSAKVNLTNSIVAGNIAGTGPDLRDLNGAISTATGKNLLSDAAGSTLIEGSTVIVQTPRLAALGHYGGDTRTMPPLAGSPAIDTAGGVDPGGTDQRGFARFVNGLLDIGAVEVGPVTLVNNPGDDAATATTLRNALAASAGTSGAVIGFEPAIFNGEPANTIVLGGTPLVIPGTANGLLIDASNITRGITLDADRQSRVINHAVGGTAALQGLTLTGGNAAEESPGDSGGAIYLELATLTLNACTVTRNTAASVGGAIFSTGSGSSASLILNACTITGNSAGNFGGAIYNRGSVGSARLELHTCTLVDNSAGGSAGGIFSIAISGSGPVTLANTILAGNSAGTSPDLRLTEAIVIAQGTNLLSDLSGSGLSAGPSVLVADPNLAPLGQYGGSTPTMPPLAGSPAIDAGGTINPGGTDQRGFSRLVAGALDIGAVEVGPVTLVNNVGDGAGTVTTLRKALAEAAGSSGSVIRFDPAVFNGEAADAIALDGTALDISATANGLFVDASNITRGVTIDAGQQSRVFTLAAGGSAALHGLTLTGGLASGTSPADFGGAIYNDHGRLTLNFSTLTEHSASFGGAIFCSGTGAGSCTLALNNTTLSSNFATSSGGGIFNEGSSSGHSTITLQASTLSGNTASVGGAIYNNGVSSGDARLHLDGCTVAGNSASTAGAIFSNGATSGSARVSLSASTLTGNAGVSGGCVVSYALGGKATLLLENSILAGNSASEGPDVGIEKATAPTTLGVNLLSDLSDSMLTASPSVLVGTPVLAPLGYYGGPTRTMPPLADSPAIDTAGTTPPGGTDQRGFSRFVNGALDIGAVEVGPVTLVDDAGDDVNTATCLRKALADASNTPGAVIRFDSALFDGAPGDVITLVGGQLEIPGSTHGLFVDASDIPGGVAIDAGLTTSSRILLVEPDAIAALQGLTFTGGNAVLLDFPDDAGGAIFNDRATLTLNACTLTGNTAYFGGAIYNNGNSGRAALNLNACSLFGNLAISGGAIHSHADNSGRAATTLNSSILAGNTAVDSGGAIFSRYESAAGRAPVTLNACTLSANSASSGGAIYGRGSGPPRRATLSNCIVWDNGFNSVVDYDDPLASYNNLAPGSSRNLLQWATIDETRVVANSAPDFVRPPDSGDGDWITLANNDYGDLRLFAGSPAIDAGDQNAYAAASGSLTDHAGQPRLYNDPGTTDSGTGTFTNLDLGAFEGAFVSFATLFPLLDPGDDNNNNGFSNFADYASGANPEAPNSAGISPSLKGGLLTFSYRPYTLDSIVVFEQSTTLLPDSWTPMIRGIDYTVKSTTINVSHTQVVLKPVSTEPALYFRERFTPTP